MLRHWQDGLTQTLKNEDNHNNTEGRFYSRKDNHSFVLQAVRKSHIIIIFENLRLIKSAVHASVIKSYNFSSSAYLILSASNWDALYTYERPEKKTYQKMLRSTFEKSYLVRVSSLIISYVYF